MFARARSNLLDVVLRQLRLQLIGHRFPTSQTKFVRSKVGYVHAQNPPMFFCLFISPTINWSIAAPAVKKLDVARRFIGQLRIDSDSIRCCHIFARRYLDKSFNYKLTIAVRFLWPTA
jgi:hypothetical protein